MGISSKIYIVIILPFIISIMNIGNAQSNFKYVVNINSIIINGDTLESPEERKGTIDNYNKNRITIYENEETKISAFIIIRHSQKKSMSKIRFDYWKRNKWIKPSLEFWCDGPKCSFNRWYSRSKSKSRGSLKTVKRSHSFTLSNENLNIDYNKFEIKGRIEIHFN